jgi:serine protease
LKFRCQRKIKESFAEFALRWNPQVRPSFLSQTDLTMNRLYALLILLLMTSHLTVKAQTVDTGAVDGHLHIKLIESSLLDLDGYTGGILALDLLLVPYGIDSIYRPFKLPGHPLDKVYRVRFTAIQLVDALITALEALTFVEFAEKMPLGLPAFFPDDLAPQQWYLPMVGAEAAWDLERGDPDVLIAIVDNAVALGHEDLQANIYINQAEVNGLPLIDDDLNGYADDINGYDTADRNPNPRPPSSGNNSNFWPHGTHVAGIAAAVTDNGIGMAGIAHGCRILPVKVAKDNGNGQQFETPMDGVFYASRSGADIINMSWGSYMNSQVTRLVIQEAAQSGAVLIAAAGNQDTDDLFYPAALPEVISVGATDNLDKKAGFSNYGSTIDLVAPGAGIYSALLDGNNTYGQLSGTSMAAPVVSGIAALVRSRFPSLPASALKQRLLDACINIDPLNPGHHGQLGAGRIDAHAALAITGIADRNANEVVSVYPNPVSAGESVRIIGVDRSFAFTLIDMTGKAVSQGRSENGRIVLPRACASGMYAVTINDGPQMRVLSIVIH